MTVNSQTGAVTKDTEFYTLGQYSKYVLAGAVRIYSSNTPAICSVAFENPDGSTALVVFNNSSNSQTFTVQWGKQSFPYTLPGAAAATYTWTGTATGSTPPMAATAQIQGSSFFERIGVGNRDDRRFDGRIRSGLHLAWRLCGLQEYRLRHWG